MRQCFLAAYEQVGRSVCALRFMEKVVGSDFAVARQAEEAHGHAQDAPNSVVGKTVEESTKESISLAKRCQVRIIVDQKIIFKCVKFKCRSFFVISIIL